MDTFPIRERAVNFSTDEKARFQSLIEKYKEILFCKKTDNNTNLKKKRTWAAIHAEFNANGDQPRSLRQLKFKLGNMKRTALKDARQKRMKMNQERLSRIRTGGDPPAAPQQLEEMWLPNVNSVSMINIIDASSEVSRNVQADEHKENEDPSENRTPKQLRRLWMNLKQRQRQAVTRTLHSGHARGPADDIISGSEVLQALMGGVDSSGDSEIVLETTTNTEPIQSDTSLCLSEESQNASNQEKPAFSTVKIEPMSPIFANHVDTVPVIPKPIQNPTLTPNNKVHIAVKENYNQDRKSGLQRDSEIHDLELTLLKEKVRAQKLENNSREAHTAALYNLEYQILKEKLREAKAKADMAELNLRRQHFSDD